MFKVHVDQTFEQADPLHVPQAYDRPPTVKAVQRAGTAAFVVACNMLKFVATGDKKDESPAIYNLGAASLDLLTLRALPAAIRHLPIPPTSQGTSHAISRGEQPTVTNTRP